MNVRCLPYGDHAILCELDDLADVMAFAADLRERSPAGVREIVPAARTVLVQCDDPVQVVREVQSRAALIAGRAEAPVAGDPVAGDKANVVRPVATPVAIPVVTPAAIPVVIPVVYDGEDLAEVARLTRLTPAEVIERHVASEFVVAFCGFAPGFAYLAGGDPALAVPRRETPRPLVPEGAVALAGEFSAVYPRASPGGWQLIGRAAMAQSGASLWDPHRDPPALLTPGTRVRFTVHD